MIIIYSQEKTYIHNSLLEAKKDIIGLYGEKLGNIAVKALSNARPGDSWRKNGGPLIKCEKKENAKLIAKKEAEIGML